MRAAWLSQVHSSISPRLGRLWRGGIGVAAALAGMVAATPASATIYPIVSGSALVTATVNGGPVGTGTILFDGSFIDFDPAQVSDIEITATSQGPYTLALPSGFPDYEEIVIDSLLIEPETVGFASFVSGAGPFSFTLINLQVNGSVTLTDTDNILPVISGPFPAIENSSLTGTITLGAGGTLTLSGIELAVLDIDGNGPLPPIRLKADNMIQAIPEPGTVVLLALGLGALAARPRRAA